MKDVTKLFDVPLPGDMATRKAFLYNPHKEGDEAKDAVSEFISEAWSKGFLASVAINERVNGDSTKVLVRVLAFRSTAGQARHQGNVGLLSKPEG